MQVQSFISIGSVVAAAGCRSGVGDPREKCRRPQLRDLHMNLWNTYLSPASIAEALDALASAPQPAVPIAGGTDLVIDLDQGRHPAVQTLVDLTSVPEMLVIEQRGHGLFIGAGVPISRVARHSLVQQHAMALVEACRLIGGPQVRNVATLGGNVAHALPAADGTIALLALDATVEIAGAAGRRLAPIEELFLGPGKSALARGKELIVGFLVPLMHPGKASAFRRVMRPQGVALPILNVAVSFARAGTRVQDTRVAVGPGGPRPWRARSAEAALESVEFSQTAVNRGLEAVLADVSFRTSPRRAGAGYRRQLIGPLFESTVMAAWEGAG
jgi:CO/xanthine dehydrogenase FAD-binding subunit